MRRVVAGAAMALVMLSVLSVGVLAAPITGPLKWSQPAYQIGSNSAGQAIYWGWDQPSWTFGQPSPIGPQNGPQAADDWQCTNQLPVTDFHWWGSYPGSLDPNPPVKPAGFWFGIYTDIPAGPAPSYSMPGQLIWSYATTNYQQTFVGWDTLYNDPTIPPVLHDATFQYNVFLPQTDWFYQNGANNILWLSIVAVYQPGTAMLEWGWKSRPHFFQDDAVSGQAGTAWRPLIGNDGLSWDLSFEISTVPEPGSLVAFATGLLGLAGFSIRKRR